MRPGLLIIDLQKAYYRGAAVNPIDSATVYINEVLPWFRDANLPIAWIHNIDEESGVVPGKEGFEFIASLLPMDSNVERRFHKHYGNSFNKTGLHAFMQENDIDTLIITGYSAESCVLSTYRGALDLDYTPVILRSAIASSNSERIRFVSEISEIISYQALKAAMKK